MATYSSLKQQFDSVSTIYYYKKSYVIIVKCRLSRSVNQSEAAIVCAPLILTPSVRCTATEQAVVSGLGDWAMMLSETAVSEAAIVCSHYQLC